MKNSISSQILLSNFFFRYTKQRDVNKAAEMIAYLKTLSAAPSTGAADAPDAKTGVLPASAIRARLARYWPKAQPDAVRDGRGEGGCATQYNCPALSLSLFLYLSLSLSLYLSCVRCLSRARTPWLSLFLSYSSSDFLLFLSLSLSLPLC